MGMMVGEQIKEKLIPYIKDNKEKLIKKYYIAMVAIMSVIAIIFVDLFCKNDVYVVNKGTVSNVNSISFELAENNEISRFISNYFQSRTDLNYSNIFLAFGKDYFKEKMKDRIGKIKYLEEQIRYERTFVQSYDNIKVYTAKGVEDDDLVCIITYDLNLGFTDEKAPMMVMFYVIKNEDGYVIKEDLDVGMSKYIMECVKVDFVKKLYEDVKIRLTRVLASNESVKLIYNSLRQFEMNMSGDINYEKNKLVDKYGIKNFDPIKDADEIYDYIINMKNKTESKEKLEVFLNRVVASLSDAQKVPLVISE